MTHFSATFSLFDSKFYFLLLSTQFFTFHEAKYYKQTPSILSYITAIYFVSNFLLPTKAAIEPGEIRSGAESADQ